MLGLGVGVGLGVPAGRALACQDPRREERRIARQPRRERRGTASTDVGAVAGCRKSGVSEGTAAVDNFSMEHLAQLRVEAVIAPRFDRRAHASNAQGYDVGLHRDRAHSQWHAASVVTAVSARFERIKYD